MSNNIELTKEQKEYLFDETKIHIMGWLNDPEICEDMIYFNKEVKEISDTIAEMVNKWDEFSKIYKEENEEPDNSDHLHELETGK